MSIRNNIIAYTIGCVLLVWYIVLFGCMYVNIGNSNDYSFYTDQLGTILGFAILGCIALAFGMIAFVGAVFEFNINATVILSIVISSLAVGASVASLGISSIIH
jgi:hypothetical protein